MRRFTDFLVFEVDLDSQVIHLKSLEMPTSSKKAVEPVSVGDAGSAQRAAEPPAQTDSTSNVSNAMDTVSQQTEDVETKPTELPKAEAAPADETTAVTEDEPWPERFNEALKPFLSEDAIGRVKQMYLEGPEPPFVSDGGWAGRQAQKADDSGDASEEPAEPASTGETAARGKGKRGRDRGRGARGGRGGRGGGRGGRPGAREDHRKVLSDVRVLASNAIYRACHLTLPEPLR